MTLASILHRPLVAVALLALVGVAAASPAPVEACGSSSDDPSIQAEQAIGWATSLVTWHSLRRVATADPEDVGVRALQSEAEIELAAAWSQLERGEFDAAIWHARTVELLLDN